MAEVDNGHERFKQPFESTYPLLLRYVARRVPADHAHDLVADVFLLAWTKLDEVPVPELPWLYRAAWNAVGNYRRSARRRSGLRGRLAEDARTTSGPRDPSELITSVDRARSAMARLRGKDLEVIRLLCWEQVTLSDAALVLGCSESAVTVRLHRARRRLAADLQVADRADDQPHPATSGVTVERTQ